MRWFLQHLLVVLLVFLLSFGSSLETKRASSDEFLLSSTQPDINENINNNNDHRQLASLAEKWNITGPDFSYDALTFSLDYTVSDFILPAMVQDQIYQDFECAEGGNTLENNVNAPLQVSLVTDTSVPPGNGDGTRQVQVQVSIDSNSIAQSSMYSEEVINNQVVAQIRFCHRFMLFTTSATPIEVNFRETLVTLFVDLTDGFSIGTLNVEDKDKVVRTANQAYEVQGYQCNYSNEPLNDLQLSQARQQGSLIRVCVRPEEEARQDGIYMRSIDQFVWERDYGGSIGLVTQVAVENGQAAANQLTELDCTPGDEVCVFDTILLALFYQLPGSVDGSGIASMQFGNGQPSQRRGLRSQRDLQQDDGVAAGLAEFELSMELIPVQRRRRSSSAATSTSFAILSGALYTVMFLL